MSTKYLTAELRGKSFALPLNNVISVVTDAAVAAVPFAPPGVCGIIFYGGRALPLFDTFSEILQAGCRAEKLCIIYVKDDRWAAYTADSANGVITLTDGEAEELKKNGGTSETDLLFL